MSDSSRVRSATEEDLRRLYGPSGLSFGVPVRPKPEDEPAPSEAEPPADEEQSTSS